MTFVRGGPLTPELERELMRSLLAGNDDALRALYARFGPPVYTLGLRMLGSAESAEELTQDVFLTAWRNGARFDSQRGRLSTWLMAIAHNLAVDRLRHDRGPSRPRLVLSDVLPEPPPLDEELVLVERETARRALEALLPHERALLAQVYFQGWTAREVAEAGGIPLGTVKTRLRAALIKLRRAEADRARSAAGAAEEQA